MLVGIVVHHTCTVDLLQYLVSLFVCGGVDFGCFNVPIDDAVFRISISPDRPVFLVDGFGGLLRNERTFSTSASTAIVPSPGDLSRTKAAGPTKRTDEKDSLVWKLHEVISANDTAENSLAPSHLAGPLGLRERVANHCHVREVTAKNIVACRIDRRFCARGGQRGAERHEKTEELHIDFEAFVWWVWWVWWCGVLCCGRVVLLCLTGVG